MKILQKFFGHQFIGPSYISHTNILKNQSFSEFLKYNLSIWYWNSVAQGLRQPNTLEDTKLLLLLKPLLKLSEKKCWDRLRTLNDYAVVASFFQYLVHLIHHNTI